MSVLDDIVAKLTNMPPAEFQKVGDEVMATAKKFLPNEGPQTQAYYSKADVLLYGGQAGGGKSFLSLGLAINDHQRSVIFRRELSQTDGLEADGKSLIGLDASFNGQDMEWAWADGRSLKLAGMKEADDWIKHAGRERDLICFDEAGEFLKVQVASLLGWNRGPEGQRCRVVLASNPPRGADGAWMMEWFGPWLDKKHAFPAMPGELRWAIFVDGDPQWVNSPDWVEMGGEKYKPLSLTFVPAKLSDNPYRDTPEYRSRLNSLPEPLRSQLLYGDFSIGTKDAANQLIPTAWIHAAQAKWKSEPPEDIPCCALGVDASGGGEDPMVIAIRHDGWYDEIVEIPGKEIPMDRAGSYCAGQVISYRREQAMVVLDLGGGYGGSMYEHLKANAIETKGFKGAESTTRRSRDGKLKFTNKRTAAYWQFREALDPGQPGGSPISLPPSQKLLADLAAPTFEVTAHGIKAEEKKKVCARLGRSTDSGDAVVMAWFEGPRETTDALEWIEQRPMRLNRRPQIVSGGRQPLSARRHAS